MSAKVVIRGTEFALTCLELAAARVVRRSG